MELFAIEHMNNNVFSAEGVDQELVDQWVAAYEREFGKPYTV